MGELEMTDKYGFKLVFTDEGIEAEIIPDNELCFVCSDARYLTKETKRICVNCGSVR